MGCLFYVEIQLEQTYYLVGTIKSMKNFGIDYPQVRLDKFYDDIEEIETSIEAVETRLYNIKQEKIFGDNVYQFLLFFDKLYDRFTDMEKKTFMKSFREEVNIYEAEQEDGRILKSLKFRFPVFFNDQELYELDWDNESTVESICLLSR